MIDVTPLPLTLSEASFQNTVIEYAHLRGWLVHHSRAARTGKGWRTAIQGDAGLPDLVLARNGKVVLAELKRTGGRATDAQRAWLEASDGHLWSPQHWGLIVGDLH